MRILVVGSGGREHAIVSTLRRTASHGVELFCAPGSDRIDRLARRAAIGSLEVDALAAFAEEERVGLTIVGGEAPLAAGIAEAFAARGLRIVAPSAEASRLETSKVYAKEFMRRHKIPTARFRVVSDTEVARAVLGGTEFGSHDESVVVKADGLAGGKGVVVAANKTEALTAATELLRVPASAGSDAGEPNRVVIEERLAGREVSLLLWTDGRDYRLMPPAQDHKRVGDGDTGPNTGGMGAVTAGHILDPETLRKIINEIIEPTLAGLEAERLDFRGVLYVGLMLTESGARVLEYNVRFGDPEAQAILVRLESDLTGISAAVAERRLGEVKVGWSDDASACVVLASRGYPGAFEIGARIHNLDDPAEAAGATENDPVSIFHSGTRRDADGSWLTAGGRVLGVTTCGATLDRALDRCYRQVETIGWDGMHYRTDIGRNLLS